MTKIGIAFSGGGIRSAAFCSGVLRRLLQKKVKIDYLSCVSGGGYTGSAYLDWKFRNERKDDKQWHKEFFNHMRQGAGIICHWNKPFQAILEFMAIFSLIFFVTIFVPVLMGVSSAYPLAYVMDFLFGSVLRGGTLSCPEVALQNPNITKEQCDLERQSSLNAIYYRFTLFMAPIATGLTCFILKRLIPKAKYVFSFLFTFCVAFFALVFFPWFIKVFFRFVPIWMKLVLFVALLLIWVTFPPIRSSATLMANIYFYSFVIYWRVFNESAFGFEYGSGTFNLLLGLSAILHSFAPWIMAVQQRLVHLYVR